MPAKKEPVHGRAPGGRGDDHHHGWNEAMKDALQKLAPGTEEYDAQFRVRVSPNPGKINEYLVTLNPR